jgi:uncharacterized short protein YbdD (DUF466 family)
MSLDISVLDQSTSGAGAPGSVSPAADLRRMQLQRIRQACRQLFGIPDYDRYLTHVRANHPGEPILSEREFHALAIDRRYGGMSARCC